MPRYELKNVYVPAFDVNGSGDSFDFDFTREETQEDTAGSLLPVVQILHQSPPAKSKSSTKELTKFEVFADTHSAEDSFLY